MEQILFGDVTYVPMDIHTAASIGNDDRVREIIENSSDKTDTINSKNADGWTSLMYGAQSGSQKVVLCLLEENASTSCFNRDGQTALMLAAMYGHIESAFLLLDNGADINIVDKDNWTALFYSVSDGHRGVTQLLLEKKCKVNIIDTTCGMTPLMYAAAGGHDLIALDLMRNGADPSIRSKGGFTAVDIAIQCGNTKVQQAVDSYVISNRPPPPVPNAVTNSKTVKEILTSLGLTKYYPFFEKHDIDLSVFWSLTDADLKDIGIELLGPRRKITNEIFKQQENHKDNVSNDQLKAENHGLQKLIKELNMKMVHADTQRKMKDAKLSEISQTVQKYQHLFKSVEEKFNRKGNLLEITSQTRHIISQEMNDPQNLGTCTHETTSNILNLLTIIEHLMKEQQKVINAYAMETEKLIQ